MKVSRILETCLYVDDLDAAERFYRDVLGLDFYAKEPERHVFLRCGDAMFLLFNAEKTIQGMEPLLPHGAIGPGHVAFEITEDEIEPWRQRLADYNVTIDTEIEWPSGGHSLYFRDPSGNILELATRNTWVWLE